MVYWQRTGLTHGVEYGLHKPKDDNDSVTGVSSVSAG